MKNVLIGLLLIVVVAVGVLPFYGGVKTQEQLNQFVSFIEGNPGYQAEWKSYNKGWLKTDATLAISLDIPSPALSEKIELLMNYNLNHGPVLVTDGFKIGWFSGEITLDKDAEGWLKENLQLDSNEPFWQSSLFMAISGDVSFEDRTLPVTLNMDGDELKIDAYSGSGTFSSGGKFSYSGSLPGLSLSAEDGQMQMGELKASMAMDLSSGAGSMSAPGNIDLSIASFNGEIEKERFSLNNLFLKGQNVLAENTELMNMSASFGLNEMTFGEYNIQDAEVNYSFDNTSIAFMEKLGEAMNQAGGDPSAMAMVGMQMMGIAMSDYIPHGPSIKINKVAFTMDEGSFLLTANARIPEGTSVANPMLLASAVDVVADVTVDKALALMLMEKKAFNDIQTQQALYGSMEEEGAEPVSEEEMKEMAKQQTEMQVNMVVMQGMLLEENGKLISKFEFKNGQPSINGQPMPMGF